jgi:hypothetical protein
MYNIVYKILSKEGESRQRSGFALHGGRIPGMSNAERFSLSLAFMSAALSVILKKESLAWLLFVIGVCFAIAPILADRLWGKKRPDREAIEKMSGDDYKELLRHRKSRRYLNFMDSRLGKWLFP